MNRMEAHEENVRRLYPELLKVVEGAEMADAGCALCVVLTIMAFREGYSLASLMWLTRGSIENGWIELKKFGLPDGVTTKANGKMKRRGKR